MHNTGFDKVESHEATRSTSYVSTEASTNSDEFSYNAIRNWPNYWGKSPMLDKRKDLVYNT